MVSRTIGYPARRRHSLLQVWIGGAFVLLTIAAFTPTYFAPVNAGRFVGPVVLHVHGFLFFAWPLLFLAQAVLVARGHHAWHRQLGAIGSVLAAAMVVAGLTAISSSMRGWSALGMEAEARAFSIIAFSGLALFAGFVTAAIVSVRRPDRHRRLMLLATLSIMQAASGRLAFNLVNTVPYARPGTVQPPSPELAILPHLTLDMLVLGIVITHDWRRYGRVHPVYVIGGSILVLVHAARHLFVDSMAWRAVVGVIAGFGGITGAQN